MRGLLDAPGSAWYYMDRRVIRSTRSTRALPAMSPQENTTSTPLAA